MSFSDWYNEADMPSKVDGVWVDLETGLPYAEPDATAKPYQSFAASADVKGYRAFAKQFGGKALSGTAKQKDWAEKIRYDILQKLSANEATTVIALDAAATAKFWIEARFIVPKVMAEQAASVVALEAMNKTVSKMYQDTYTLRDGAMRSSIGNFKDKLRRENGYAEVGNRKFQPFSTKEYQREFDGLVAAWRAAMDKHQSDKAALPVAPALPTLAEVQAMRPPVAPQLTPRQIALKKMKAASNPLDGLKAALELFDLIAAQKSAEQYDERIRKQAVAMPAHIAELMANGSPDAVKVANLMQVLLADMAAVGADTDDLVVRDLLRRQSTLRMNQGQAIAGRMVAFDSALDSAMMFDSSNSMIDVTVDPVGAFKALLGRFDALGIIPTGRDNTVKTAKGTKVGTKFAIVEADRLITSHDANGKPNPKFPQELQPRDRERESSQAWVQKVSANLDSDSLGRTGRADSGAPIVGKDGIVESGNGRTMAIKLAYQRGTADEYRQFLMDDADYFGLDPDKIEAMKHPVLVRVRTTDIDRRVFTVEANQDDKLTFTATELARSDAKRLDENMLALFNPSDDGDILGAANQRFIQAFLKSLGDTEAAQYMTKDGKPTKALVDRIKAAVFSKAYNDDRLLEMMADDTKPEIQNVLNALGAASSKFIEAQAYGRASVEDTASAMIDGIEQSLDKRVVDAVVKATNTLLSAKANNQDIAEYVRQQGLFEDIDEGVAALAVFLSKNSRSAKRMAVAFKAMAEYVKNDALDQANIGLFGEPTPPSMIDVVNAANDELVRQYGDDAKGIGTLFDSALDSGMDSTELGAIYSIPVDLINTDPKAYQWRTDVDENGLDGRDLDDFDQAEQAPILLHELEDGRMYVVDGHHRLAMAEYSGMDEINARIVREDDGYSVEDAKLLGQMLNHADLVGKAVGLMQ